MHPFRQPFIRKRAERHKFCAEAAQKIQAVFVIKAKCLVARNADADMLPRFRNIGRRKCERRRALCDFKQRVQVDRLACRSAEALHFFLQVFHLCRGDEAEVPALKRAVRQRRQKAAGTNAEARFDLPLERGIAHRGAAVQHNAADAAARHKAQESFQHGKHRQPRPLRVQHEHNGTLRPLRDLKGARARRCKADAVVIAHHALDERHIFPRAGLCKKETQCVIVKKEGI